MTTRLLRWLAGLALALHALCAGAVVDESKLLPVDSAFALSAHATGADTIAVQWKIADGYYLYRHRISVQSAADGVSFAPIALPQGAKHHDEFFGDVQTYRQSVTGTLAHVLAPAGTATLRIKYQGCADVGVCYPPQTRVLTVALATPDAQVASSDSQPAADSGFSALGRALGGAQMSTATVVPAQGARQQPLPPEQAFGFDAIARDGNTLLLRFTPAPGYYLYRDKTSLRVDDAAVTLGAPRWPKGVMHRDEHFGNVVVYFGEVDPLVPLQRTSTAATTLSLSATFQGCQDGGLCYPPMTRSVRVALPAGVATTASTPAAADVDEQTAMRLPTAADAQGVGDDANATVNTPSSAAPNDPRASLTPAASTTAPNASATNAGLSAPQAEDSRLAALLGAHRWWALLVFFGSGLVLAFTPCVWPMVPILSGLIAGGGVRIGAARAFWLSLVYVLATAVVFTIVGVVAGLLGANLQAAMQRPWVLVLFALLFVALALSMFGLYELQLPSALRARLGAASDRQHGGSMLGVAAMGALSALIVGPCVAPPLAAAVLYIAQSHDPVFGGLALFVLALGMGVPLIVFGVAAGRGMPTSGPWMVTIQRLFGFVFIGLAIWMLSRILPGAWTLALFGLLCLALAAWLFTQRAQGERTRWAARFAGLAFAVVGAAELFGALAGGSDPLQPLASLGRQASSNAPTFRTIKSSADLDRELAAARAAGKPVLFDFYADWCVSCKEMERYTFPKPGVRAALGDFVLLKADVTANDATDQVLMQRFGLFGPPATLFFRDGTEQRGLRLTGFEAAGDFARRLERAK